MAGSTPARALVHAALALCCFAGTAHAQTTPTPAPAPAPAPAPTPAQIKARYSLPWTMRPGIAPTLLRLDTTWAFGNSTTTGVTLLTGGYAILPTTLGVYARGAFVHQQPAMGTAATSLTNPIVFGLYTPQVAPGLRVTVFAGCTIPVGMGGGNTPDQNERRTVGSGVYARSAMDNALFAVNYVTPTAGLGLVYTGYGLTAQMEATVLQLFRVRGETVDRDDARTNLTLGFHVGYQIIQWLIGSVELHYQHWLTTPAAVAMNPALRAQTSLEFGLRGTVPLTRSIVMRPGVSFGFGLGGPMLIDNYRVLHVDLPVAF